MNIEIKNNYLSDYLNFLEPIIASGGPELSEWNDLNGCIEKLALDVKNGNLSESDIASIRSAFGDSFGLSTMQGFAYQKPHGYACLLYTSPSPRDLSTARMPSSA